MRQVPKQKELEADNVQLQEKQAVHQGFGIVRRMAQISHITGEYLESESKYRVSAKAR